MGNCLPAKEQNSGIDSMRLSQSTPGEDGEEEEEEGYGDTELKMSATSEKKFSSNVGHSVHTHTHKPSIPPQPRHSPATAPHSAPAFSTGAGPIR